MDIFKNNTMAVPKSDPQIVRVDMEQDQIQGRKSHLPGQVKNGDLSVSHVADSGATGANK